MTDVTTPEAAPVEAEKAPKVVKEPQPCACSAFLLADEKDVKEGEEPPLFDTECTATTMRVFAQGHDARLVSFLVNGEVDGLTVLKNENGVHLRYDGAAHAASSISEALGAKAEAAVGRLRAAQAIKDERTAKQNEAKTAKANEKADKKAAADAAKLAKAAAKAAAPKSVAVKVVDGSQTSDAPANGLARIKVGRGEYDAELVEVDGKPAYKYLNMKGEEETRDADLVRVLVKQ